MYTVGILSQFMQNPGPVHWEGVKQIISYLNTTKNYSLTFGGTSKDLLKVSAMPTGQAKRTDWHSISGYTFYLGSGVITWSLKRQHVIMLSSTESEYIAQMHTAKEALWIQSFIIEIQGQQSGPIELHCDNQGVIVLAKDNKLHSCTKHIDLQYHFIQEAVEDNKLVVKYIPTKENVADIFTKAIHRLKFEGFVKRLGLRDNGGKEERTTKP